MRTIRKALSNKSRRFTLIGLLVYALILGIVFIGCSVVVTKMFGPSYRGEAIKKLPNGQTYRPLVLLPEQGIFGGVCAGLAYKFGIDPWIPRGAFLIGTFVIGDGVIVYAILWAVLDSARTPVDYFERINT